MLVERLTGNIRVDRLVLVVEAGTDTLNRHGTKNGLPHVLIEMRQDLIVTDAAAQDFAAKLKPILDMALLDMKNLTE